ncbi:hypothetical protein [Jatrophihabitans fulvus]
MTQHHPRHAARPDALDELVADRRNERLMLWRGVIALLVVLAVVAVREYFLV